MTNYDSSLMRVLRCFSNTDVLGFTELAELLQFETDLTGYYLRRLQSRELIEKVDRGQYRITPLGKSLLAHARQLSGLTIAPRVSIMLVSTVQDTYIITKRTAQPFIGKVEWPTGPLLAGESLEAAARRVANERLGLDMQPELHGFFRRIDMLQGTVFDDKLFAIHTAALAKSQAADIVSKNPVGEIMQYKDSELKALPNQAKSFMDISAFLKTDAAYAETIYNLTPTDLY